MCDICDKYGTSYRCSATCNFDLCQKCYGELKQIAVQSAAEHPLCVIGHPVLPNLKNEGNICDMCDVAGVCGYRCSKGCNYDLCEPCYTGMQDLGKRIQKVKREEQERKDAEEAEERA